MDQEYAADSTLLMVKPHHVSAIQTIRGSGVATPLGIVANDNHKPRYLREFETIKDVNRVCIKHKQGSNQHLIIIDKAIETFLLWNAAQVEMDLANYGFDQDVK